MIRMRHLLGTVIVLGVVACSGEPSAGDLERALRDRYEMAQVIATEVAGKKAAQGIKFTVHSVRKIACKQGTSPTVYQCEGEIDMTAPVVGRTKQKVPILLMKGPQGWRMAG